MGELDWGKTHLLHAIGHEVHRRNPSVRVKYISSESYINELIQCIRLDRMDEFRYRYRSECDVLLIDDIQFIAERTELRKSFSIRLTACMHLTSRLSSPVTRFLRRCLVWKSDFGPAFNGVYDRCPTSDLETRLAILESKARREGLKLPEDLAMYLATHVNSNVRELEGALIRVNAYASLAGMEVSLETARRVLRDVIQEQGKRVTADRIIKDVCAYFGVKANDLKGSRRHKVISQPRMVAMYLCRKHTAASYPEIGRKFGGRDHSTVINSVSKVTHLLESDARVIKAVESLERGY